MREIKFRAWDKNDKQWFKTELEFYGFTLFGECTLICPPRLEKLQDLEITQFTGLKDKNGKEIYEGDILKKTYGSSVPIFFVAYHVERAAFIANDGYNELLFNHPVNLCEIIGNIYENPDLLK